ncbi:MAG: hypothetical protein PHY99_10695 [Bacteroidales bacterium]|nr:hypothetical protein [Bacteroidales bacterium]
MKKKFWRLAVIGIALALIVGGFVYWYGFLRKETPIEKMKADFVMTADSLSKLFNADEKTATEKFSGKILILNADLISVEKDERGNFTLTLVDPMTGVTCTIDSLQAVKQKAEIDLLTEGMTVTVKGRCDGILMDVKMSKCMIVAKG